MPSRADLGARRHRLVLATVGFLIAGGATVALAAGTSAAGIASCKVTGVSLYVAPNPSVAGDAVRLFP
jgi:hypothetical protein